MHAKTNGAVLLKYPYTFADLREENPYTYYDNRFTLPEWYAQTDEGLSAGNTVVEVKAATRPEYDKSTHCVTQRAAPELIGGEWVLGWDIVDRSLVDPKE
jgi:hypothetical protein